MSGIGVDGRRRKRRTTSSGARSVTSTSFLGCGPLRRGGNHSNGESCRDVCRDVFCPSRTVEKVFVVADGPRVCTVWARSRGGGLGARRKNSAYGLDLERTSMITCHDVGTRPRPSPLWILLVVAWIQAGFVGHDAPNAEDDVYRSL